MTKDRDDHKPHLSLLSLSHISWTFTFKFRNDDLLRVLFNSRACNFEKNRAQGLFWRKGNITTISGKGKQCYEIVLTALSKTKRKPVGTADHQLIQ